MFPLHKSHVNRGLVSSLSLAFATNQQYHACTNNRKYAHGNVTVMHFSHLFQQRDTSRSSQTQDNLPALPGPFTVLPEGELLLERAPKAQPELKRVPKRGTRSTSANTGCPLVGRGAQSAQNNHFFFFFFFFSLFEHFVVFSLSFAQNWNGSLLNAISSKTRDVGRQVGDFWL